MQHRPQRGQPLTDKTTWYEGRGIWVYSFLYRTLAQEQKYLDVARKSVEFILPHRPKTGLWPASFTQDGVAKPGRTADIYGGLFVANGLAEFARATGDDEYRVMAKEIVEDHVALYDSPEYRYDVTYSPGLPAIPGPRVLGHWMVLLRFATQYLEAGADPWAEQLAKRSTDALLDQHFNPAYDLFNEVVNHDGSRAGQGYDQFCYIGHAIETLWMVMFEADRRKDDALLDRAAALFRRHVEIAWDDVYQGFFRSIDHVDDNRWQVDKVLWLQEEVLIGTLFLIEKRDDRWAREWFARTYDYVRDKWPLAPHGHALWILSADRKVTYEEKATRVGNFHHPRHLMLNLLALDRISSLDANPPNP
ncbi:MAG: AGE family epimerase/isomerase [Bryobacterales bacterium]